MRIAFFLLFCAFSSLAGAQSFPSKPVRIVIGFTPGGGIDTVARLIGPKMSESLGQPVVVENKPGGAGILGADAVAKSPADGHTVFFGTLGNLAVNPLFLPNLPFDADKDFAPVTQVVSTTFMLFVNPSLPVSNTAEFIAYGRANPGKLNFCSAGNGGLPHLAAEAFANAAGFKATHVPYKGSAPCIADLIGGQIQFAFEAATIGLAHVKSGKLRTLGTTTARRLPALADVPTVSETLPGFEVDNWYGMVVPAGTPRATVQRLRDEVLKAMNAPEIRDKLVGLGQIPVGSSPEEFGAFMKSEGAKWIKVIREAKITPG